MPLSRPALAFAVAKASLGPSLDVKARVSGCAGLRDAREGRKARTPCVCPSGLQIVATKNGQVQTEGWEVGTIRPFVSGQTGQGTCVTVPTARFCALVAGLACSHATMLGIFDPRSLNTVSALDIFDRANGAIANLGTSCSPTSSACDRYCCARVSAHTTLLVRK